jgi:hypothetical protein
MEGRRGRPVQVTDGRWRHSENLGRRVVTILSRRDLSDPQTITEVTTVLLALARRVVRPRVLDNDQEKRLRHLAVHGKPSEIIRILQSWRFRLPDRKVRALQRRSDIQEMIWQ